MSCTSNHQIVCLLMCVHCTSVQPTRVCVCVNPYTQGSFFAIRKTLRSTRILFTFFSLYHYALRCSWNSLFFFSFLFSFLDCLLRLSFEGFRYYRTAPTSIPTIRMREKKFQRGSSHKIKKKTKTKKKNKRNFT